jgi:hypothetical protein
MKYSQRIAFEADFETLKAQIERVADEKYQSLLNQLYETARETHQPVDWDRLAKAYHIFYCKKSRDGDWI